MFKIPSFPPKSNKDALILLLVYPIILRLAYQLLKLWAWDSNYMNPYCLMDFVKYSSPEHYTGQKLWQAYQAHDTTTCLSQVDPDGSRYGKVNTTNYGDLAKKHFVDVYNFGQTEFAVFYGIAASFAFASSVWFYKASPALQKDWRIGAAFIVGFVFICKIWLSENYLVFFGIKKVVIEGVVAETLNAFTANTRDASYSAFIAGIAGATAVVNFEKESMKQVVYGAVATVAIFAGFIIATRHGRNSLLFEAQHKAPIGFSDYANKIVWLWLAAGFAFSSSVNLYMKHDDLKKNWKNTLINVVTVFILSWNHGSLFHLLAHYQNDLTHLNGNVMHHSAWKVGGDNAALVSTLPPGLFANFLINYIVTFIIMYRVLDYFKIDKWFYLTLSADIILAKFVLQMKIIHPYIHTTTTCQSWFCDYIWQGLCDYNIMNDYRGHVECHHITGGCLGDSKVFTWFYDFMLDRQIDLYESGFVKYGTWTHSFFVFIWDYCLVATVIAFITITVGIFSYGLPKVSNEESSGLKRVKKVSLVFAVLFCFYHFFIGCGSVYETFVWKECAVLSCAKK